MTTIKCTDVEKPVQLLLAESKLLPAVTVFYNPAMGCRVITQQFRIQTHPHTVLTLSTYKFSFGVTHKTYFS